MKDPQVLKDLLVMKFGGTSVGSAERMRAAAAICAGEMKKRPVVAVVSAMSKVTDLLIDSMRHAEAGDRWGLDANIQLLQDRHIEHATNCCRRRSRKPC